MTQAPTDDRAPELREALDYLRPDPANKAGLLLNAEKARAAVATIDAAFATLRRRVVEAEGLPDYIIDLEFEVFHLKAERDALAEMAGEAMAQATRRYAMADRRGDALIEAREALATAEARAREAEARADGGRIVSARLTAWQDGHGGVDITLADGRRVALALDAPHQLKEQV